MEKHGHETMPMFLTVRLIRNNVTFRKNNNKRQKINEN